MQLFSSKPPFNTQNRCASNSQLLVGQGSTGAKKSQAVSKQRRAARGRHGRSSLGEEAVGSWSNAEKEEKALAGSAQLKEHRRILPKVQKQEGLRKAKGKIP